MNLNKIAEKYGIDFGKEYIVSVDYENNAEEWWDGGGRELWRRLVATDFWHDDLIIGGDELIAFLAEAEKIPGWSDGPDHAKYPFCNTEVE